MQQVCSGVGIAIAFGSDYINSQIINMKPSLIESQSSQKHSKVSYQSLSKVIDASYSRLIIFMSLYCSVLLTLGTG